MAQSSSIVINDDHGNLTTGTIRNGNLYFYDSNGHTASGTIRAGNVYLTTDRGDYIFGTIKSGSVQLTDQSGMTTGTIRNGYIMLNNSDGSTTSGTYNNHYIYTQTTPSLQEQQQQMQQENEQQEQQAEQKREIDQENYEAGQEVGAAIGNAIAAGIANHRITRYCRDNPTGTYVTGDGVNIQCENSPLDSWEQEQEDNYCADNPGSYMLFGRHRVDCVKAPYPANLKWATWEVKTWGWDYNHQSKAKMTISSDQIAAYWTYWRGVYCELSSSSTTYKDLHGKKQHCG